MKLSGANWLTPVAVVELAMGLGDWLEAERGAESHIQFQLKHMKQELR